MNFGEKLSAIMTILGVSNKKLSLAVHVDASLVSRWRSGSRVPQNNSVYIKTISKYLATNTEPYHVASILSLLNLPIDMSTNKDIDLTSLICEWLSRDTNNPTLKLVDNFLRSTDMIAEQRHWEVGLYQEPPSGHLQTDEIYYGDQGIQDAYFKLLRLLLTIDEPRTIYMFSDMSMAWLDQDAAYDALWREMTLKCIQKGHQICVIHDVVRNYYESFAVIERWMPLFLTGKVKSYYCPRHLNNVYRQCINIVPGLAAITGSDIIGNEQDAVYRFQTDRLALEKIMRRFEQHLKLCRSMLNIYTKDTISQLREDHLKILHHPGNTISSLNTLSSITMPESVFIESLNLIKLDNAERRRSLRLYQLKRKIFLENLKTYNYWELLILPEPKKLLAEGLNLNLDMFFYEQTIQYRDLNDIKKHISYIIELLENNKNYRCYLLNQTPFHNIQLQSKDTGGIVFTKQNGATYTFILAQQNLSQIFYDYMENAVSEMVKQKNDREYTLNRLREYLAL